MSNTPRDSALFRLRVQALYEQQRPADLLPEPYSEATYRAAWRADLLARFGQLKLRRRRRAR